MRLTHYAQRKKMAAAGALDAHVRIAGELVPKLHYNRLFKDLHFEEVPGAGERLTQALAAAGFPKEISSIIEDAGPLEMVLGGSAVLRAVEESIVGKEPKYQAGDFDLFVSGAYDNGEHIRELHRVLVQAGLEAEEVPEKHYTRISLWRIETVTEYRSKTGSVLQVVERCRPDAPYGNWMEKSSELYSARDVILSTDFDMLRNYFDGARVWSARVAIDAIKAGVVGIPSSICCDCYEAPFLGFRAAKYTERGFVGLPREVYVRVFDQEKLPSGSKSEAMASFFDLYEHDPSRTERLVSMTQEVFILRSRTKSAAK